MRKLRFRSATDADVERLLEIHLAAYPDERGLPARTRNFEANPLGGLDRLVVAEDEGGVVGHAFLFALETFFGGRKVKTGGVASLAVAPEARGEGVGAALLGHLHALSAARGDAITMLYAFRYGFYARFGYAVGASRKRLTFDPRSVPRAWRTERPRAASGADHAGMRRAYRRAALAASGWMTRSEARWESLLVRDRRHHLVLRGGEYVAFQMVQAEPHAATTVLVEEIAAGVEGRRALLGALGAMRDQVAEVVLEVDADDPLELALVDPDARRYGTDAVEHRVGEIVGGPMVRLVDVRRAIEARGYGSDGGFVVEIAGGGGAAPERLAVDVRGGRARVAGGGARRRASLSTDRAGLAAVLYGGLPPSAAAALGLARAAAEELPRLDALLRLPPLAPIDAF